jgi:hypothetical protein
MKAAKNPLLLLIESVKSAADKSDLVLLDTCALQKSEYNSGIIDDLIAGVPNEALVSYRDRLGVMAALAESNTKIALTPEVRGEVDRLYVLLRDNLAGLQLLASRGGATRAGKRPYPDLRGRINIMMETVDNVKYLKNLDRLPGDTSFDGFASRFRRIAADLGHDYGPADVGIAARAFYENIEGRQAAVFTNDTALVRLLDDVYPVIRETAGRGMRAWLDERPTLLYLPDRGNLPAYKLVRQTAGAAAASA